MKSLTFKIFKAEFFAFSKAQISAFLGGLFDFLVMIFVSELIGLHYVWGVIAGGILGALVNFEINRKWAFKVNNNATSRVLLKFGAVVMGSIVLKSLGTYGITTFLLVDYRLSRLITDAMVCFGFNYTLQRLWVFKKTAEQQ